MVWEKKKSKEEIEGQAKNEDMLNVLLNHFCLLSTNQNIFDLSFSHQKQNNNDWV